MKRILFALTGVACALMLILVDGKTYDAQGIEERTIVYY